MSYSISTLLTRNLHDVFGEHDEARRRAAIDEIFTEDCVFYEPHGVHRGRDQIDRVAALTDRQLAENSVAVDFRREAVSLTGVAGLPTFHRGVADHQFLFVNGRPVKDRLLIGAVRRFFLDTFFVMRPNKQSQ